MIEEKQVIPSNENLVEEHSDYLFQFAMSKLKNRELSLDFVQETLLTSLEKQSQFEGRSSLRTWMTTILNRKIIDYWRKNKKQNHSISSDELVGEINNTVMHQNPKNPHEISEQNETLSILEFCMDKLPEQWREILHAKFYDEKNGEEISKEFSLTSSNFWVIVHRAKAQLRGCMDKKYLS
jgi:RNA polymerase sigma-70 factor (ECF subfamily)